MLAFALIPRIFHAPQIMRGSLTRNEIGSLVATCFFLPSGSLNRRRNDPTRASNDESSRSFSNENIRFGIRAGKKQLAVLLYFLANAYEESGLARFLYDDIGKSPSSGLPRAPTRRASIWTYGGVSLLRHQQIEELRRLWVKRTRLVTV